MKRRKRRRQLSGYSINLWKKRQSSTQVLIFIQSCNACLNFSSVNEIEKSEQKENLEENINIGIANSDGHEMPYTVFDCSLKRSLQVGWSKKVCFVECLFALIFNCRVYKNNILHVKGVGSFMRQTCNDLTALDLFTCVN